MIHSFIIIIFVDDESFQILYFHYHYGGIYGPSMFVFLTKQFIIMCQNKKYIWQKNKIYIYMAKAPSATS